MRADFALVEDGDGDVQFAEVVGDGAADDATSDDEDAGGVFHGMVISRGSYSPPLVVCMKCKLDTSLCSAGCLVWFGLRRLYHSELGLLGHVFLL